MLLTSIFSISYIGTIALSLIVCLFTWHLWKRRSKNSPPGTNGLPLVGVLFSMGKYTERIMTKWAKQYGPLYMIKVGPVDVVVISCPDIAYEAFAKCELFNDRPQSISLMSGSKGILFVNKTDLHKEQRRFGLNTLRLFGMGRRTLEPRLIELSNDLCDKIDDLSDNPIAMKKMIFELVSSVISSMIFGYDITVEDEVFAQFLKRLSGTSVAGFLVAIMMFAPVLKYVFPFSYVWNRGRRFQKVLHQEIEREIKKHVETLDAQNPRDYIDCFLIEMEKFKQESDTNEEKNNVKTNTKRAANTKSRPNPSDEVDDDDEDLDYSSDWVPRSSFDTEQLVAVVRDLFIAGVETTSSTLLWLLMFMCKHPEIQKKLQDEIDEVLGPSGLPRMTMMEKLPYVRAVIQEILRIRPIAALSVPHKVSKDTVLRGYLIPKEAIILTNIWGIHHDENRWPEPTKFMPERHLDENGKYQKSSNWMPFGVGGRSCLGQQLANMELFLTTITLFRRFEFSFEPGFVPDLDGESVVALRPLPFNVCAKRR